MSFVEQPDPYQISNYNIQPLITIEFVPEFRNYDFSIVLVADYRIEQGFYQTYKMTIENKFVSLFFGSFASFLSFPGLKLNTMKYLKEQAKRLNTSVKQTLYRIEVTAGGFTVSSKPFKIVSSFTQLPPELQQIRNVRLNKITKN